ncbi:MAG: co-chaperone GroES [Rickettsiaceae bacterium]|jgi:chaperonin GroES|uniref:co-chaperone GroES n=1 Tax=Candidatus Megaera polyxenophila TaxID=988779 RepID=UPI001B76B62C|nr:co-chaperone GroES [Candidatus Megaera polyxenophila]MBM3466962.1 co-chaperone GroES [Alphaproteobacteria bacterium]MBP9778107.1 co-chaperone GroES [Rickettsiaceae bacterium]HJK85470.1 co-chaperone GroES [Candidatus Megaera endosymbiont of Stentor roeselii]MCC8460619.1 co-chaperone GroES [Candidatus Megaera polyxenophila]MCE2731460.1 co-chaperone GroES [Rickettsiaceae bacterium]
MNFTPLHDRVAIKPMDQEEKTLGGIIIPDTAKEKPMQGKVIAVGKGTKDKDGNLIPLDVKVGDKVLYGKWGGTEVKVNGQEFIIMKESDIMGIIN